MHPIERLRFLARLRSDQVDLIAHEAAATLLACAEPAELVVACRRLLDRHPAAGPLWWVASAALTSTDGGRALLDAMVAIESDPTPAFLEAELAVNAGAVGVLAWAVGDGVLAGRHDVDEAVAARAEGRPVIVGAGECRVLPGPVWEAALTRVEADAGSSAAVLPWECVTLVLGPEGPSNALAARRRRPSPVATELLSRSR